ncbi:hypothetical protein [Mycobacteroides chelonae]|nr:hypothetical protein [Mycobacteroides chelonae]
MIGNPAEADWVVLDHVRWGHRIAERITHPDDVAGVLELHRSGRIDMGRVEEVLRANGPRLMRRYLAELDSRTEAVAA